jgi:hypothetical protein
LTADKSLSTNRAREKAQAVVTDVKTNTDN